MKNKLKPWKSFEDQSSQLINLLKDSNRVPTELMRNLLNSINYSKFKYQYLEKTKTILNTDDELVYFKNIWEIVSYDKNIIQMIKNYKKKLMKN
jgi:hypothetical protein